MTIRLFIVTLFFSGATLAATVDDGQQAKSHFQQSMDNTEATRLMGVKSQQTIDQLANQQQQLLAEYQALLKKSEYQKSYNQELTILKKEQTQEIALLKQQIADIKLTKQQLLPLLREMVATLEQFIRLDLPFKLQQRLTSIDKLKRLLSSSRASISEKYRRVMELYQAENDYNYDLEVYRDNISMAGDTLSVQILRIGRSNLYMQTMDGNKSAMWNRQQQNWQLLGDQYQLNIRKAMRVAAKKSAPELLNLPYITDLQRAAHDDTVVGLKESP